MIWARTTKVKTTTAHKNDDENSQGDVHEIDIHDHDDACNDKCTTDKDPVGSELQPCLHTVKELLSINV